MQPYVCTCELSDVNTVLESVGKMFKLIRIIISRHLNFFRKPQNFSSQCVTAS